VLKEGPKLLHWNYFLALESDLERLSRYVEFTKDNYKTYSLEMAHLLLAASSEVDVVLKGLCNRVDSKKKPDNIDGYREILRPKFPRLCEMQIRIPRFALDVIPWENWQSDKNPNWWRAYNKVKHDRAEFFKLANLQNTVAAIAGLFVATMYLYKEEAENGSLVPLPNLLTLPKDCTRALKQTDFGITLVYRL